MPATPWTHSYYLCTHQHCNRQNRIFCHVYILNAPAFHVFRQIRERAVSNVGWLTGNKLHPNGALLCGRQRVNNVCRTQQTISLPFILFDFSRTSSGGRLHSTTCRRNIATISREMWRSCNAAFPILQSLFALLKTEAWLSFCIWFSRVALRPAGFMYLVGPILCLDHIVSHCSP